MAEFSRPPTDHNFPITDIGNNVYLKVVLESLPRIDDIPLVKCMCKRRASKEIPVTAHEELVGKLNDLSLGKYEYGNSGSTSRRLSIPPYPEKKEIVDDRMHTPCSENGKHRCNCDDESDGLNQPSSTSIGQETKKLDERRLKEIAKYKRRLRKESKLKKLCDSTSSEGDSLQKAKETHTSIPILQAARFDRFRAIGCYRNQTYLTLPASRMEGKSPFVDSISIPPVEMKKTVSVSTQTDDIECDCGMRINIQCESCRGMVRSEANYNLASLDQSEVLLDAIERCQEENGGRRKCEEEDKSIKKLKCDNISNIKCDIRSVVDDSFSSNKDGDLIKRPKYRRCPMVGRIDKIVTDRQKDTDIEQLHLKADDTVFSTPKQKQETKRQKTYSINDDGYVLYEKCDYGTIDKCEMESPKDDENGFKFPEGNNLDPKKGGDTQVPSPSEMDRFRWRFDSAASMVFHTKTGLPLTSSPAPLRRGNNCFDFDDSINGISGIKRLVIHTY